MQLLMTVLRCPDQVAPEARTVSGGEFQVGRGPDVDWVLPDTDRLLSKRHFAVAFRGGAWQVADTSTNGTYLNAEHDPIGHGTPRTLRDGDRLRVGGYEIEARLIEQPVQVGGFGGGRGADQSPFSDPFADNPLAPPSAPRRPFDEPAYRETPVTGARLPHDFDPLAPDADDSPFGGFRGPVQSDHSSAMDDAVIAPEIAGWSGQNTGGTIPADNLLPDDWDKDLLEGIAPASTNPTPEPARSEPPEEQPVVHQRTPRLPVPPREALAEPPGKQALAQGLEQGRQPDVVHAAHPFVPDTAPSPFDEAPPPLRPLSANSPTSTPLPASGPVPQGDDAGAMAAFLKGAALTGVTPADPIAMMTGLGHAFRALIAGLRAVLIARARIKSEFRIEQTMIRARGNNPLKFSANDDDALTALLGAGRRTDMSPAAAIEDSLRDLRLHELAVMAAMQVAVRGMLDELSPDKIRAGSEQGGMAVLPAQRKARAWEAFEARHAAVVRALTDDFDSLFGKTFARAYEKALDEISARDRQ